MKNMRKTGQRALGNQQGINWSKEYLTKIRRRQIRGMKRQMTVVSRLRMWKMQCSHANEWLVVVVEGPWPAAGLWERHLVAKACLFYCEVCDICLIDF